MPSQLHELILMLFRTPCVLLAQSLSESSRVAIPAYSEARIDSADLTEVLPTEYRADLVITLVGEDGAPVMGIIVEAQLARDERKRFVWPAYAANLRARLECPVCLLVVTLDEAVARWASQPIELGGESVFVPVVLGPAQIARVTDVDQARKLPELAVLSAMAHGRNADVETAVKIGNAALAACAELEADKARLYVDVVYASLSEQARQEVKTMDMSRWEPMSDWARGYVAQGRAEGRTEGRAEGRAEGSADVIRRQLAVRFGALAPEIEARIRTASAEELSEIGVRILTATSLEQVFQKHEVDQRLAATDSR